MNNKYCAFALALTCILGLSASSGAQGTDGIVVTVPFDFVAGASVMPAGTYEVRRLSADPNSGVILRGDANTVVVLPMTVAGASAKPNLTFQHSQGKYFLGKIETAGIVYTLATSRPMMTVAGTHNQSTGSPGGSN